MNAGNGIAPDAVARGGSVAVTVPSTMNAGKAMRPNAWAAPLAGASGSPKTRTFGGPPAGGLRKMRSLAANLHLAEEERAALVDLALGVVLGRVLYEDLHLPRA